MPKQRKSAATRPNKQSSGEPISELWGLFSQWCKNRETEGWHLIVYADKDGKFRQGYVRQGGDLDTPLLRFSSIEDGMVELMGLLIDA